MKRIEVGFRCNNACVFCAPGRLREELPDVPHARIEAQLAEIHSGDRVAFVGGEPTIFDELPSWATTARERGAWSVLVQTNGRRLAVAGYAHRLVASGVDGLDVSLHGATEAMHDYHTQFPGSFRETVSGLRRARAAGLSFGITTVVTRSNYRHLHEIVHVAHTLGARALQLMLAEAVGAAADNHASVVLDDELALPHLEQARVRARQLGLTLVTGGESGARSSPQWFAGRGRSETPKEPLPSAERRLPLLR